MVERRRTISQIMKRFHSVVDQRTIEIFIISFVGVGVTFVNKLVMLKSTPGAVDPFSIKQWVLVFAAMLIGSFSLIYVPVKIFSREPESIKTLKKNVVRAWKIALEESSFNPRNSTRNHERRNS